MDAATDDNGTTLPAEPAIANDKSRRLQDRAEAVTEYLWLRSRRDKYRRDGKSKAGELHRRWKRLKSQTRQNPEVLTQYEAEVEELKVEELKRADSARIKPPTGWNDPEHCWRRAAFLTDHAAEVAEAERVERLRPSPPGGKPTPCGPLEALGIVGTADTQWTAPEEREVKREEREKAELDLILETVSELDTIDRPRHADLYKLKAAGMTVEHIVEVTGSTTKIIRNMLEHMERRLRAHLSPRDVATRMGSTQDTGSRSRR